MKTQFQFKKNQGFALLLVCLGGAVIIGIGMTSYLTLVHGENATTARSQVWNNSMVIAEAGIEEGMALVNKYVNSGMTLNSWSSTAAADGWTQNGSAYTLTRNLGTGHYTVIVTPNGSAVTIKSTGTVPGPDTWSQQSGVTLSRAVQVNASGSSSFQGALLVKKGITLSGSAMVDSFDSSNPLYSSNGLYNLSKHTAKGNMMTDASNVVMTTDFSMSGGSHVYGKIYTAPNNGIANSGGTIGDTNFAGPGVQSGWTNSTANVYIPDAPPVPSVSWLPMPTQDANKTYVFSGSGPGTTTYYRIPSSFNNLGGGNYILVTNGTVYVDVESAFQVSGSAAIIVAPNANVVIWFNAASATISGSGLVNQNGNATDVTIYGTPNCTTMTLSGSSGLIGTIYAPYANITYSGSAAFIGSAVANSFTDSGGAAIHYDEALGGGGAASAYIVSSWAEVPP